MTDTSSRAGGRPPTNIIAGNEYRPIVGTTAGHPTAVPPGLALVQSQTTARTVVPGRANATASSFVVGLAAETGIVGHNVTLQTHGILTLTIAEWDAVTGGSGGLVRDTLYYLTAGFQEGRITSTPPSTPGEFIVQVGMALSATDLLVQIGPPQVVPGG